MKKIFIILFFVLTGVLSFGKELKDNKELNSIKNLLKSYRNSLASSNPSEVVKNFSKNAVLMGTGSPTAEGENLVNAYGAIFDNVGLDLDFTIENVILGEKYAFVQSVSNGTAKIKANGNIVPEENRELFILEKVNGDWKIARYMFNKMDSFKSSNKLNYIEVKNLKTTEKDKKDIENLIKVSYRDALASGISENIIKNFSKNPVLMPPATQTFSDILSVKEHYKNIFNTVALDLDFTIDEIVFNGDYAFVRSTSEGIATIKVNGQKVKEVNRELWVVCKENNEWKIKFYMYNKSN